MKLLSVTTDARYGYGGRVAPPRAPHGEHCERRVVHPWRGQARQSHARVPARREKVSIALSPCIQATVDGQSVRLTALAALERLGVRPHWPVREHEPRAG